MLQLQLVTDQWGKTTALECRELIIRLDPEVSTLFSKSKPTLGDIIKA